MAYSLIVDSAGRPIEKPNGHPRPQLIQYYADAARNHTREVKEAARSRRSNLSYDAARDGDENRRYWAAADGLDSDSANSYETRKRLRDRSRYEAESNPFYAGIVRTHVNMLVGVGPTLRMLTDDRAFNQLVETEWSAWCERVQYRKKLWSLCWAKIVNGEGFWVMQTNPSFEDVQLDIRPIEADQVHTPYLPVLEPGYVDGIRFDPATGDILWYDILHEHPGGTSLFGLIDKPIRVLASQVVHWFKALRPGTHRGVPDLASSLNCGAAFRRWREAVIKKAEVQSAFTVFLETGFPPEELDPVSPMDSLDIEKGMMSTLPVGQRAKQLENNTPGAQYEEFRRSLVAEQARPISMPYNAAACDSSTYSFASGKLDTLCYRGELDVERADANEAANDPVFAAWYREWVMIHDRRRGFTVPVHQWDWPAHPVIDDEADARAKQIRLNTGLISFRQAYSDAGQDYEDHLAVMAQDWFGSADPDAINKARQINLLRNCSKEALPYIAGVIGLPPVTGVPTDAQ